MNKQEVARILQEIALLLELSGENPFKSRAYANGARTIELLQEDLTLLVREKRLETIRGIGAALAEKITEIVLTGRSLYYEELRASIPPGVIEMLRIPGLGPKKVQILYDKLGISSIRELEYAVKENRLVDLPGFGAKSQAKVLTGIEYIKSQQGMYYYSEALIIGQELIELLAKHPAVSDISLAGSIRRAKEVVKDIDLVAASDNPEIVTAYFAHLPEVREVLGRGQIKASVIMKSGIQADLLVVNPLDYPYALHHFTGSKEHNVALRHLAKEKGLKINEYGVFREEEIIPCKSEEEIYQALGLNYIPPELRENNGEIEAARQGPLPPLVKMEDIQGIFHIHTHSSDGDNSLEEVVEEAKRLGYKYLGISDHSQSAFYARGLKIQQIREQQEEIERVRELYPEITIFSGIESDIKADGSLDYPDDLLFSFDFVIASVHSHFKMSEEEMTKRIIKAMSHPAVTMLGHPTGRILLARPGYALNMERILERARDYGVIIELNASPARLDLDWRYLRQARDMGIMISINPDAHRLEEMSDAIYGVMAARKGWLTKKDIFNCYDTEWVKKYLLDRKRKTRN